MSCGTPRDWSSPTPGDIRAAKRAPLLFDDQRSLRVVDPEPGPHRAAATSPRAAHRRRPLGGRASIADQIKSGSLVAEATTVLGGVGFFLRADRSLWTFVDGHRLLVPGSEHWTAFPLELTASIENIIGGGRSPPWSSGPPS